MQVTETVSEGLKREFRVVVEAAAIEDKIKRKLADIGRSARLPGFRPGKIPAAVLQQRYGQAVAGEVLEEIVNEGQGEALRERGLRPALQPKVEIVSFDRGADLEFRIDVEILPDIAPVDFGGFEFERLKPVIPDEEVDRALERIAASRADMKPVDDAAANGDTVVADYEGRVDGVAFDGGKAEGQAIRLGAGMLVPGFEEQLVGMRAGETREITVTFPGDYRATDLAGKAAVFSVSAKEVRRGDPVAIDASLAAAVGFDTVDEMRTAVREQIERDYAGVARQKLKRHVLDRLAEAHQFDVPPGMLESEFDTIWKQVSEERARGAEPDAEDAGKDEETLKRDYRGIAERRVRLGLLLAEIGRLNNIQVSNEELSRAVMAEARHYPGQEREVFEAYRSRPELMAGLRAPLFEDKVIDFIVEMARVTEKPVAPKELLAPEAA